MSHTLCATDLQSTKRSDFFPVLRKNCLIKTKKNFFFAFSLIPMSRIICTSFHNIEWYIIQLDFIFIIYISYIKNVSHFYHILITIENTLIL